MNRNCCGNCKHWKKWSMKKCIEHDIASAKFSLEVGLNGYFSAVHSACKLGDCDKIEKDRVYYDDGHSTYTFDGYCFEDECYDEYFNCFEDDLDEQDCRIYSK